MRRAKIVCTLGPATDDYETIKSIISAGMNVARFNFSHGTHEKHKKRLDMVRRAESELSVPIGILLDTKGPEIRTGLLKGHKPAVLRVGSSFILTTKRIEGDESAVYVDYEKLPLEVSVGQSILIDDGKIRLEVKEIRDGTDIVCVVVDGGELGEQKGINIPGADISLPVLTERDISDLKWGVENNIDYVAVSFVRKPSDIIEIKEVLSRLGSPGTKVIAKIETKQAVDNFTHILEVSDGIMVARGDLGVELPTEDVPVIQKSIIKQCNDRGKPVITATQMLESMMSSPRPTRAEASDVANAVFDGSDALMLSGETAAGKYPVESVKMMVRIIEKAESEMLKGYKTPRVSGLTFNSIPDAVSHATCTIADDLSAAAILTSTSSGATARMVAKYRPVSPIFAATPLSKTEHELALVWGVYPFVVSAVYSTDDAISVGVEALLERGWIGEGDLLVITAGVPIGTPGTTNLIKVHSAGRIIAKGKPVVGGVASGNVVIVSSPDADVDKNSVLVLKELNSSFLSLIKYVRAVIVEESKVDIDIASAVLSCRKPVVVGVSGATGSMKDGMKVTIDGKRGVIYKGEVHLGG